MPVDPIKRAQFQKGIDDLKQVFKDIKQSASNKFNAFINFFGGSSNANNVVETITDKNSDTPDFSKKSTINKITKKAGPLMTATSIVDDISNPNLSSEEKVKNTVQNVLSDTPVIGPGINMILDNSRQEDGIFNLDNDRMSEAFSTGKNAASNMAKARANARGPVMSKKEIEKLKRARNNGYQRALRGGKN